MNRPFFTSLDLLSSLLNHAEAEILNYPWWSFSQAGQDNGHSVPIRDFGFSASPLDLVFLSYGDLWVSAEVINHFNHAFRQALGMRDENDRAALVIGDRSANTRLAVPLTYDIERVWKTAVSPSRGPIQGRRFPGYRVYDALGDATAIFAYRKERPRRRAIVAITSDRERHSTIDPAVLTTQLLEKDVTLNAYLREGDPGGVTYRWSLPGGPAWERKVPDVGLGLKSIQPIVEATGGEMNTQEHMDDLADLVRRLKLRYLLAFYADPEASPGFHEIEVRLTDDARNRFPNALVRTRRGYYLDPAKPLLSTSPVQLAQPPLQ